MMFSIFSIFSWLVSAVLGCAQVNLRLRVDLKEIRIYTNAGGSAFYLGLRDQNTNELVLLEPVNCKILLESHVLDLAQVTSVSVLKGFSKKILLTILASFPPAIFDWSSFLRSELMGCELNEWTLKVWTLAHPNDCALTLAQIDDVNRLSEILKFLEKAGVNTRAFVGRSMVSGIVIGVEVGATLYIDDAMFGVNNGSKFTYNCCKTTRLIRKYFQDLELVAKNQVLYLFITD